jgi:hypothetical protein
MATKPMSLHRSMEGRQVTIALRDGTRIDDCNLVSTGRNRLDNLWLVIDDEDVIVARGDVVDMWPTDAIGPRAA